MGSKNRIAKYIVPIIQKCIDDNNITEYYEPFVGGANIIDKINCLHRIGNDLNSYLIALLSYVRDEGKLLDSVSKSLYDEARTAYNSKDTSNFEDWKMGNIGFLASYNGRFFDGGYANSGYEKTKNGIRYRDYYNESKNNILNQAKNLKGITFLSDDYETAIQNPTNNVIYCDPPYNNTKQYANATSFDFDRFWKVVSDWSENNFVFVSEEQVPTDWVSIWNLPISRTMNVTNKFKATENLFIYKDGLCANYFNSINLNTNNKKLF